MKCKCGHSKAVHAIQGSRITYCRTCKGNGCKHYQEAVEKAPSEIELNRCSSTVTTTMNKCQCEHDKHFDDTSLTPKAHLYGALREVYEVKTDYGTYHVCKECSGTCLLRYKKDLQGRS